MRLEAPPGVSRARTPVPPERREVCWAGPGLLRVRQRVRVRGREPGTDVTGPYWVFALVRVHRGGLRYLRGAERVRPPGRRFAVFMPPWSIVRAELAGCTASTDAVASGAPPFEGAPARPVAWPWRGGALPGTRPGIERAVRGGGPFLDVSREAEPSGAALRAKAILDGAYCRPLTLGALAREAGLSASVISRAFKRAYGMPPVEYRHRLRVMDAMFRLAAGGGILAVLEDVGFGDASRLYSHFRSLLCAPPGSFSALGSRNAKT